MTVTKKKNQGQKIADASENVEKREALHTAGGNKIIVAFMEHNIEAPPKN